MSGNREGGYKARDKIYKLYGKDLYREAGRRGGSRSQADGAKPKGFASEVIGKDGLTGRERAIVSGFLGGKAKRRKYEKV